MLPRFRVIDNDQQANDKVSEARARAASPVHAKDTTNAERMIRESFAELRAECAGRPAPDQEGVANIIASHLLESWALKITGNAESVYTALAEASRKLKSERK